MFILEILILIVFAVLVYRHASGIAQYNKLLIWAICLLSVGICLPVAYIGYLNNPNRSSIRFRDVL